MPFIILFQLLLLNLLVTLPHEVGHFAMARLLGVAVPEFGIGLPPTLVSVRWRGTRWSLNLLPLGAFVGYTVAGTRPMMRRSAIAVAGPLANLLVGLVCLGLISTHPSTHLWVPGLILRDLSRLWGPWKSFTTFLHLLLAASVAIGCLNLLPVRPLDGGKLLFVALRSVGCGSVLERQAVRIGLVSFGALAVAGLVVIIKLQP